MRLYFLNNEMIQIRIATTITITIIPTAAPALKMPVITEQLLKKVIASNASKKVIFFIVYNEITLLNTIPFLRILFC